MSKSTAYTSTSMYPCTCSVHVAQLLLNSEPVEANFVTMIIHEIAVIYLYTATPIGHNLSTSIRLPSSRAVQVRRPGQVSFKLDTTDLVNSDHGLCDR